MIFCRHHYIRARFSNGDYGLRCQHCQRPYIHTWNEILGITSRRKRRPVVSTAQVVELVTYEALWGKNSS